MCPVLTYSIFSMLERKFLLGIGITNATENKILEYILQGLGKLMDPYYIVTPNPEILVFASKHPDFKAILNNARLALCDGIGIISAGKILGKPFKKRVTGVDLMEHLCKEVSKQPITVGFLGGGPGIAEKTAECLVRKYPELQVVFAASEWKYNSYNAYNFYNDYKKIDLLFVAFGFPKQEEWMATHIGKVPVKVMMAVGGSLDYVSGTVSRAPRFLQGKGLEWLFRLIVQPWRWKRQLALIEFVWLVLKERMV